jgi:hypothetical protein
VWHQVRCAIQLHAGIGQFYQPLGNGYVGGFPAGISYRNINSYSDPSIVVIQVHCLSASHSGSSISAISTELRADGCNMTLAGFGNKR